MRYYTAVGASGGATGAAGTGAGGAGAAGAGGAGAAGAGAAGAGAAATGAAAGAAASFFLRAGKRPFASRWRLQAWRWRDSYA